MSFLIYPILFFLMLIPTASSFVFPGTALHEVTLLPLFTLRRSANQNELRYEVRSTPAGFKTDDPIYVYWIMNAEKGQQETLTGMERRWAYGVSVREATPTEVTFSLRALPDRLITVKRDGDRTHALLTLSGELSELTEVFIQTAGEGPIPKIQYVKVHGKTWPAGTPVSETIRRNE